MSYAEVVQAVAVADAARPVFPWAIGGTAPDETRTEVEYAIEPERGGTARCITDELYASVVEDLPDFRDEARIITRTVTYGPWRYVTPQELVVLDRQGNVEER